MILNPANSTIQTLTPDSLCGRMMCIYAFIFFGLMPIGALFIWGMGGKFGEPNVITINIIIIAI